MRTTRINSLKGVIKQFSFQKINSIISYTYHFLNTIWRKENIKIQRRSLRIDPSAAPLFAFRKKIFKNTLKICGSIQSK